MSMSEDEILTRLQQLTGNEFEHFIADVWERQGMDAKVTAASGDRGIDIVAEKSVPYPEKTLIQTKRYSEGTTVTSEEIQQYHSTRDQRENVDKVIVVTTSRFTEPALELAHDLNVKCIDRKDLAELIQQISALDVVENYTSNQSKAKNVPNSALDTPTTKSTDSEEIYIPSDESDSLAAELTGIRWVETNINTLDGGILSRSQVVEFAGYIATFRLFGRDNEWGALIEFPEEVKFVTDNGEEYHPITLASEAVPENWRSHSTSSPTGKSDGIEIPRNSRCNYFAAVTMPRSADIEQIRIDRHNIEFTLDGELSYQLRNLPLDVDVLS